MCSFTYAHIHARDTYTYSYTQDIRELSGEAFREALQESSQRAPGAFPEDPQREHPERVPRHLHGQNAKHSPTLKTRLFCSLLPKCETFANFENMLVLLLVAKMRNIRKIAF